ncbi:MAG: DNA primase [Propionibacteriaceae bacterium]
MAGRIHEEDIQTVRERARVEEVVGSYVSLKPSGAGTLKGLCPFHDEKTPSFQVTSTRNLYYCFGCGEGGDVIDFVMKINNLSFSEALEHLADKTGVQLRYVDGDGGPRVEPGLRVRILLANQEAAEFYQKALLTAEALPGRLMLDQRGFDRQAAELFGVGWAPQGGRALTEHLRRQGFKDEELIKAGLTRQGGWDFFQGRVLWPIRDAGKSVLGFGARRIFDDDKMPAKYLNTPETPVYKKSQVLYGLDLARQHIGKKEQAVIVEGYTDVMAAHLSGVDTAVASCGTAFGEDHAKLLQRLIGTEKVGQGEIIFTFDGDVAGQAAALKAFKLEKTFSAQTYVAVEPSGMDPCDLRMAHGEAAVRELVGRRIPLYRFVLRNTLAGYDLDRADSRVQALRAAAPLVTSVRDRSLVTGFTRELAGMLGMPENEVAAEVKRAASRRPVVPVAPVVASDDQPMLEAFTQPDPRDRSLMVERDVAKLLLQAPELFTPSWNGINLDDFSHIGYQSVWRAVQAAGERGEGWVSRVRKAADSVAARELVTAVSVEPPLLVPDERYVDEYAARLQLLRTNYDIAQLKSKLQRTNPVEQNEEYRQMFTDLVGYEARRKELQQRSIPRD